MQKSWKSRCESSSSLFLVSLLSSSLEAAAFRRDHEGAAAVAVVLVAVDACIAPVIKVV